MSALDCDLKEKGWTQSKFGRAVFFKRVAGKISVIATYVDDLLVMRYEGQDVWKEIMKGWNGS